MEMQKGLKMIFAGQDAALFTYGDDIWIEITDNIRLNTWFQTEQLINRIPCIGHLSERTQNDYIRAVLMNVELEYAEKPDEECPVTRRLTRSGRTAAWCLT